MAFITFNNNTLTTQLNNAVSHVSVFNDRANLANSRDDTSLLSGKSQKLRITYENNSPQPRIFTVKIGVEFPENRDIKLTGGGPNDTYVEVNDFNGHRGVWSR
ncbi:hypothetical protein FMUND_2140 [Fusarium mundagurra]|uniref:Uncharacterized protein n=1 Tax=Fusarium mundagurra TaxID=1567541 RepID=A0A8H5Z2M5_9HYPO|nr:hypothetical protein FMUND_2140 [Fusarium mundagurra]